MEKYNNVKIGDRVRVTFEGEVVDDTYEEGGFTVRTDEGYSHAFYVSRHYETGAEVEIIEKNHPEPKLGQVWDCDGERFMVVTSPPSNSLWLRCANNSSTLSPRGFFNVYPDAELILDA